MHELTPLEQLSAQEGGNELPLPPTLVALYGPFSLPVHTGRPYVISNFVTTLDGVVALNDPAHPSGGDISGSNTHDRVVMGLLRAVADAVIVGAGTLRAVPTHRWTAEYIYPSLSSAYQQLRTTMGKAASPLNVIVTASGAIDLSQPLFQSNEVPVLLVTTPHGAHRIALQNPPPMTRVSVVEHTDTITAREILQAVQNVLPARIILVEGGPQLMGNFLAEQCLDELFLTLAPQIAGRTSATERPGFVSGTLFAPDHPLWSRLISIRRAESYLFLRYRFASDE
ncbi:MAG: dihydrofolate reductase family protein [Ktedonobacteraceae bacterium]